MRRLFCRHRCWIAIDTIYSELPDAVIVSWTSLACQRCGKRRHNNLLKPKESIALPWDELIAEVTGEGLSY